MSVLRKVQPDELQAVNKWLESYLPESWGLFCLTRSILTGRWEGQSFYTLGWPDIRGVVTGEPEPNHPSPDYHLYRNFGFIYAPEDDDVMILLSLPEVLDWSKRFIKGVIPGRIFQRIEERAKDHGVEKCIIPRHANVFYAKPGDIQTSAIPKGYRIRPLKTDSEIDYCVSTWSNRTPYAAQYFRALVEHFPSACVVDDQDRCLSFEIGTEYGDVRFLHTREEARRKGLAKAVISYLAEEYRQLGLGLYSCVMVGNEASYSLHLSMGFEEIGIFSYPGYSPQ